MEIDLALLPIGGTFTLCGKTYKVLSISKRSITFEVDGKKTRLGPFSPKWGQFCRDVEGLVVASCHGVDAGCLRGCVTDWG